MQNIQLHKREIGVYITFTDHTTDVQLSVFGY